MKATITRKSRNLGIAATAYANNGPKGWYFAPLDKPESVGGCATIRRQTAYYRRIWSGGTYYRIDLFIGGKRVAHDTGDVEKVLEFCRDDDADPLYREITVTLDGDETP